MATAHHILRFWKRFVSLLMVAMVLNPFMAKAGKHKATYEPLYKDKEALASVAKALDYVYNYQFAKSDSIVKTVPKKFANHPAMSLLMALHLQWQYAPIDKNPEAAIAYRSALEKASDKSEEWLNKSPEESEAIFFAMMAQTMLGKFWANQNESLKAVNATRKAYSNLKEGMKLTEKYPEFYFSTGLYNYYRIRFPEDYPIYKAFLVFFPDGNKEEGIRQLGSATEKGLFTRYEAHAFLTYIFLHNDNKPDLAYEHALALVKQYPKNPYYRILLTETCLSLGQYAESAENLRVLENTPLTNYYKGMVASLEGWFWEKNRKDQEKAQEWYRKALDLTKPYANTTNNFRAIAYAGLARLSKKSKPQQARQYYKNVEVLAKSSVLKAEARNYLKEKA